MQEIISEGQMALQFTALPLRQTNTSSQAKVSSEDRIRKLSLRLGEIEAELGRLLDLNRAEMPTVEKKKNELEAEIKKIISELQRLF